MCRGLAIYSISDELPRIAITKSASTDVLISLNVGIIVKLAPRPNDGPVQAKPLLKGLITSFSI